MKLLLFGPIGTHELVILGYLVLTEAAYVLLFWKVFSKAGLNRWFSFGMLFPVLNLGVLAYLAFARWPKLGSALPVSSEGAEPRW